MPEELDDRTVLMGIAERASVAVAAGARLTITSHEHDVLRRVDRLDGDPELAEAWKRAKLPLSTPPDPYGGAIPGFTGLPFIVEDCGPRPEWCEPDDCPAAICNGPHVEHRCPNGDLVVSRVGDPTPCPFCGWTETAGQPAH